MTLLESLWLKQTNKPKPKQNNWGFFNLTYFIVSYVPGAMITANVNILSFQQKRITGIHFSFSLYYF